MGRKPEESLRTFSCVATSTHIPITLASILAMTTRKAILNFSGLCTYIKNNTVSKAQLSGKSTCLAT